MNQAGTALRFFFHVTLGRPGFGDRMARIPSPECLPVVLSPEEVALLLPSTRHSIMLRMTEPLAPSAHAPNLKYRAALSVAYGCGLRISEIANLKITDIDSARMLIRVEQGKGRKALAAEDGSSSSSASTAVRHQKRVLPRSGSVRHDRRCRHHRVLRPGLRGITGSPRTRSRSPPRSEPPGPARSDQSVL